MHSCKKIFVPESVELNSNHIWNLTSRRHRLVIEVRQIRFLVSWLVENNKLFILVIYKTRKLDYTYL